MQKVKKTAVAKVEDATDSESAEKDHSTSSESSKPVSNYESNNKTGASRWGRLLWQDKGNIYIIKEIVEVTEELKKKIDLYNSEQRNKELQLRPPELIVIEGFDELRAIVDRERESSKKSKVDNKKIRLATEPLLAEDYDNDQKNAAQKSSGDSVA
jgi:hypothetical protein